MIWIHLLAESCMDGGSLYQLQNIVNRRNVGQDCATTKTEAHILATAMEVFQIESGGQA